MKYYCCDQRRLEALKHAGKFNGLEYLEVDDSGIKGDTTRQRSLFVKFLRALPGLLSEYDLSIKSVANITDLASTGSKLAIVALVGGKLHIRIFDAIGNQVLDKDEKDLMAGQVLTALKQRLNSVPDESTEEKQKIIEDAALIAGYTLISKNSFRIEGGERIKTVEIDRVSPTTDIELQKYGITDKPSENFLLIHTKYYGDFSQYTLRLVSAADNDAPPIDFDPRLSEIQFSFKVQCPSDFDCVNDTPCPIPPAINPHLDYLAKDYASFRRLMLDRISTLMPEWQGRNPADVGITMVELLAYFGDQLSYQQDAIATEAYLGTARKRVSLRRHARLVDYRVHEGCNARVWVQVQVEASADAVAIPAKTQLLTQIPNMPKRIARDSDQLREAMLQNPVVFETVEDTLLYQKHNDKLSFYTWGERQCCLPKGAIRATLNGKFPHLKAGDVLVFAETRGPRTGYAEDADRSHRWAVRLTDVRLGVDPSGGLFNEPPDDSETGITEIQWAEQDALPFPLCLSAVTDEEYGSAHLDEASVAYGNIVLADHGRTIKGVGKAHPGEELSYKGMRKVPATKYSIASVGDVLSCKAQALRAVPPRFRPQLSERPLTQAFLPTAKPLFVFTKTGLIDTALQNRIFADELRVALQAQGVVFRAGPVTVQGGNGMWSVSDGASAHRLHQVDGKLHVLPLGDAAIRVTAADPQRARPDISLISTYLLAEDTWSPQPDLLASKPGDKHFVVESEHDGSASLRFGDDEHGMRPNVGTSFKAIYRIGNGTAGNIGLESIAHIVSDNSELVRAWNPLPAKGGVDPEKAEDIRRDAPEAFRTQERAVTPADYAEVTERHPSVQRAAATFRWTGSWYTVFLTVDRKGGDEVDEAYKKTIRDHVERYRMAGYDLEVNGPVYVPLQLDMDVCIKPDYFRGDVRAALMRVFSRGWLPDGSPALFHPDNFTFGQPVYLSKLYAAAQATQGVASVTINSFQRLRMPTDTKPLEDGVMIMGRLEIAQLDNNPNFPERGVFKLSVGGGK
jgi:hypothetical protein